MQKRIFIPYRKVIGSSFLQGSVASINSEKNFVQLQDGDQVKDIFLWNFLRHLKMFYQIRYDQLVIAVGTKSQFPNKSAEVDTLSFSKEQSRLQQEVSLILTTFWCIFTYLKFTVYYIKNSISSIEA